RKRFRGGGPVMAADLLLICRRRGITLTADGGTLRFRAPEGVLTPELRADLVRCKAELLVLLPAEAAGAWDQAEADRLIERAQTSWVRLADAAVRRRLGELADRIDAAYLARDLAGVRSGVAVFLAAAEQLSHSSVTADPGCDFADDETWIKRALAYEWGVSAEHVWLWSPGSEPQRPQEEKTTSRHSEEARRGLF